MHGALSQPLPCNFGGKPKSFRRSLNRLREKTVGSKNAKTKTFASPSCTLLSGRVFVRMTRTRTRTYGVVTPSSRQPLLEAMLRAFVWRVSNVVSMLATIINRPNRDWHTDELEDDQCPTPSDITEETQTNQPSFSGKCKAHIPSISIVSTQGTTPCSPRSATRMPGTWPSMTTWTLSHSLLSFPPKQQSREAWEPRGDARQSGKRLLASSSRTPRASGMTPCALLT